jgi:hypothetical protein
MTRDIPKERAATQHRLTEVEAAMKRAAYLDDAEAFAEAKAAKQQALDHLDRLEWAEKAIEEEAKRVALEKKVEELERRQGQARAAHERVRELAGEVGAAVERLSEVVKQIRDQKAIIDIGVNYEAYGVKDGLIERQSISPILNLGDADVAVRALRSARELVRLSPISLSIAEQRASQGSL